MFVVNYFSIYCSTCINSKYLNGLVYKQTVNFVNVLIRIGTSINAL